MNGGLLIEGHISHGKNPDIVEKYWLWWCEKKSMHISSVVTSNLHETTFFDPLFYWHKVILIVIELI